MSHLQREIRRLSPWAANVLEEARLFTDSDIESLTREELHELFPGHGHFKLRRSIFDLIHKQNQKPVEQLLREMRNFIPDESFKAALTNNGVLVDYLHILKDIKTQLNNVQHFLDAHICVLEEPSTNQPDQELAPATCCPVKRCNGQPDGCPQDSLPGTGTSDASGPTKGQPQAPQSFYGESTSATCGPVELPTGQTDGRPQGARGTSSSDAGGQRMLRADQNHVHPQQPQKPFTILSPRDFAETSMVYRMVVGGKTFDAHLQLMEKVKAQVQHQDHQLIESSEDYEITFVFCPISSRILTDVEAALRPVNDDKPVILVLMHHKREAKYTSVMRPGPLPNNIVLHVNVFYHETMRGLLKCQDNDVAVSEIGKILLECFIQKSKDISGNAQWVGAESGLAVSVSTNSNKSTNSSGGIMRFLPNKPW